LAGDMAHTDMQWPRSVDLLVDWMWELPSLT
jgi:hypothetical protein